MKYLLDSNTCISVMRGKKRLLISRFFSHPPGDLGVCSVVVGELYVGAIRSSSPANERAKVDTFLAPYQSLPFDDAAARKYAEVRADLETRGVVISDLDMMIAATAQVHGLTVVTHNFKDFSRVPGLALEDWERP
ncbi:MAG TPA: type II toxin-antitoxin system VapC family toxin [Fimbriiglobus sp.]|nr:type II toxin-antitoxin system VapC family toxin [Fimbriiglobus sp.]